MSSGRSSYVDDNACNSDDDVLPTDMEDDDDNDDDDDDDGASEDRRSEDNEDNDENVVSDDEDSEDGQNPSWRRIIDDTLNEKVDCVNVRYENGTEKRFHPRFNSVERDELEKIVKAPSKHKVVAWSIWYHKAAKNQSNKKVANKKADAMKQLFGKHNGREKSSNDDGKVESEFKYCTPD